jgi:hypothetical protein
MDRDLTRLKQTSPDSARHPPASLGKAKLRIPPPSPHSSSSAGWRGCVNGTTRARPPLHRLVDNPDIWANFGRRLKPSRSRDGFDLCAIFLPRRGCAVCWNDHRHDRSTVQSAPAGTVLRNRRRAKLDARRMRDAFPVRVVLLEWCEYNLINSPRMTSWLLPWPVYRAISRSSSDAANWARRW